MHIKKIIFVFGCLLLAFSSADYASGAVYQIVQEEQTQLEKQLVSNKEMAGKQQQVSMEVENESLISVLRKLAKKVQVGFSIQEYAIPDKKVTLSLNEAPVFEALDKLLKGTNLEVVLSPDRDILVIREKVGQDLKIQLETITGTVTDAQSGETLPGVNVMVKGTTTGASSGSEGNYELNAPSLQDTLIFSFVGYQTREVPISGRTEIDVALQPQAIQGEEMVVVGYGTMARSDLTGSVEKIGMKKLEEIPAISAERILQGRVAGLQVINSSQDPGAGATAVRIRGGSSLRGSNAPLVVVDGFPLGDAGNLNEIDPASIESVEILKDASASAIYGSRGANGVIIVTTKQAQPGETQISVKQQATVSQFTSKLDLWRDPISMAELSNESRVNAGLPPLYVGEEDSRGVYYPSVEALASGEWPYHTRWDELVFRDLPLSNNTRISISSANEQTRFNLSGNLYTDKGVYIEDDYSKLGYNLGIEHKVFDELKVSFSNILTRGMRDANGGLNFERNIVYPVYDESGDYYLAGDEDFSHPIALTENRENTREIIDVLTFLGAEWQISTPLRLTTRFNYKYSSYRNDSYYPKIYSELGAYRNGTAQIENWLGRDLVSETFANYSASFGKHALDATLGFSYERNTSESSNLGANDFVNEVLGNENLNAGNPDRNMVSNGFSESELVSSMSRFNYTYNDKYLLTLTARLDGSSKFGENNKWALFPSGAISWKAQEEKFVQALNVFDELKFRLSYGISGNQGISPYQTLSRYGVDTYYTEGSWETAIGPGREVGVAGRGGIDALWGGISNPDLKWETTAQADFGIDMAFLNNRVQVTFDYYHKLTSDLLREQLLPPTSGYDQLWVNNGKIENKGIELTIDGTVLTTKDWNINTIFIYYRNRNEVVGLGQVAESGLNTDPNTGMEFEYWAGSTVFRQNPNILAVGQPVRVFYGLQTNGIIQEREEGIEAGLIGDLAQPGEFKYADINDDGIINTDDRTIIGDPNPDFSISFELSASYKRFNASIFFNGVFGNDVLNTQAFNASKQPLRWTPDNPTNAYPSLRDDRRVNLSDWWIEDGSFLRIQNLSLGYTLDLWEQYSVRLFINTSNLYTFTNFEGYDPEVGLNGVYEGNRYPRLRKITLGANLTF